jgi:endo-1,4-beta-xylanase
MRAMVWTMAAMGIVGIGAAAERAMTLRQAAGDRILIGAAVMSAELEKAKVGDLVAAQFNCLTGENEFKPDSVEHVKGQFTFEGADKIIAFAEAHDMKVVGHNLLWHQQTPKWMFQSDDGKPLSRDQALANLKEHIDGVAGHFKGKVIGWDVVNEAISDNPNEYLRDTPERRAIGDDYIAKAFELAHAADPGAQLYYNEYSNEAGSKRDHVIKLIRDLKAKGVKIDGVGIQGHWMMKWPDTKTVEEAIAAYEKEGVKVMISELDIDVLPRKQSGADISATEKGGLDPYKAGLPADVAQAQAKRYADLFAVFMRHPGVITRVTFWGVHDGTSWLNNWPVRGRTNYPMLWDRDLTAKPALDAVVKAMQK